MKTSHHMDCIALIATSKTNYKEWPYVSMFSWSIDHLKNGRQVGGGGNCWKKTAGLTNLLSASLQGKGAHADLFILSWISRQWWRVQGDVRRGVLTDEVSEKSNSFSNTSLLLLLTQLRIHFSVKNKYLVHFWLISALDFCEKTIRNLSRVHHKHFRGEIWGAKVVSNNLLFSLH